MITTTLDQIVRRTLLECGYPIHWYCEFLYHASTFLRERSFDTLQIINTVNLPIGGDASMNLPQDFVDDVCVCVPSGQSITKLPKQDWITPIRLHDSTSGQFITYENQTPNPLTTFYGFPLAGWNWFFNVDSFGFPTGRFFGATGGISDGYAVFKQQRRIQMTSGFANSNAVLIYISDGQSVDAATQIDTEAFMATQSYIIWKQSPNKHNPMSPEALDYSNQCRLLRARMNDLTITDIRNEFHKGYTATIKT